LISSFDDSFIDLLKAGTSKNLTMIVDIDTTEPGFYEVTVNASVKNPVYNDWAKFYINIEEEENFEERIIFTEEFIVGNPECIELKELVDEAKELFSKGQVNLAKEKLDESLEACKRAIEQEPIFSTEKRLEQYLFNYIGLASIVVFVLGFLYYTFKRMRLRRIVLGSAELGKKSDEETFNNNDNF